MMSLGTWNARSTKYQRFLNLSNVFMLIVSTMLVYTSSNLIGFYHLTKLDFWSWHFYACPICMLALGLYTFAVSVYGFLISNQESRGLISLVAVFFSIAFLVQLFSIFTAFELRNKINLETNFVTSLNQNMRQYTTDEVVRSNWDTMQKKLRCCGGMQYDTGFNDWDNVMRGDVPDSCCHPERMMDEGCGKGKITLSTESLENNLGIWKDGCLTILKAKLREEVSPMLMIYSGIGVLLALVELITVVFACSYIAQISRRTRRAELFSRADTANDEEYQPSLNGKHETNF